MKTKLLCFSLLMLAMGGSAFAQLSAFSAQELGGSFSGAGPGNAVFLSYAPVRICNVPASGSPCTPLASVFDLNGNALSVSGPANFGQTTTDAVGRWSIQCNPGVYEVQIGMALATTLQKQYLFACPVTSGSFAAVGANNAFTGNNTFKDIVGTKYVSAGNPQSWSGADACAWINSAIAALPTSSGFAAGVVDITGLASNSTVPCGTTVNAGSPYLWLRGPGAAALTFNCTVNGDCFNTQEGAGAVITPGFRMSGFSVHGTGTANGVAFHLGDMVGGRFDDLAADGFTGTNGACMWFENKNFFFEANIVNNVFCGQTPGSQLGNTKDYRWSVTTASVNNASFQYNRYYGLKYSTLANQTAFSFEGGVHNGGTWQVTGNTTSATGTTVIAMSGSIFPTSGVNTTVGGTFSFKSECTGCSGAAFYSIPAGYILSIDSGSIADNGGFTYTVAGSVTHLLNPSPLEVSSLVSYSASGVRGNQYNLTINNPAANRTLSIFDPGGNANFCLSLSCSLTAPSLIATGPNTNAFTIQHQVGGNTYQFQVTNPFTTRTFTFNDANLMFPVAPVPLSAGGFDVGSTALPWGNLWLGTAGTNNFKFAPAATAAARTITIADPGIASVGMTLTIANGTAAMTTAAIASLACGSTVTVAATGVLSTDVIILNSNGIGPPLPNAFLTLQYWPIAGNVNFSFCNSTAASQTPVAETLSWKVVR